MASIRLLALVAVLALVACGASPADQAAARQAAGLPDPASTGAPLTIATARTCADRLALAVSSSSVVPGAWACQDPQLEAIAAKAGIHSDVDVAHYGGSRAVRITAVCPVKGNLHVYLVDTNDPTHTKASLVVITDPDGRVNFFGLGDPSCSLSLSSPGVI